MDNSNYTNDSGNLLKNPMELRQTIALEGGEDDRNGKVTMEI